MIEEDENEPDHRCRACDTDHPSVDGMSLKALPLCPQCKKAWGMGYRCGEEAGIEQRVELLPLAQRIAKGRSKYANGCTVLSLLDEAGEVAHAVNKYEPEDRIRDELLDVAAVAMRLFFGEIDRGLEIDGLSQRRTSPSPGGKP